jgi:hypothetical protein
LGAPVLFRTIRGIEDSLSSCYDSSQNQRVEKYVEKYKEGNSFTDFDRDDSRFEPWAKSTVKSTHPGAYYPTSLHHLVMFSHQIFE